MRSPHQLGLDPLSDTSWRLCDRATSMCDADSVIAYIELRRDGRYEVTWVAHGIGTAAYSSMAEVRDAAAVLLDEPVRRASTKPVPIPHRPPLGAS